MRTLFLLAASLIVPAVLASQSAPLACEGRIAIIRISEIKPSGTVQGFLAAVAAHKEWYVSHGYKADEIYSVPLIVGNANTGGPGYSDQQFMSFHIMPGLHEPEHDAAWDAYVKLYQQNSDIKSTYTVCMPNMAAK